MKSSFFRKTPLLLLQSESKQVQCEVKTFGKTSLIYLRKLSESKWKLVVVVATVVAVVVAEANIGCFLGLHRAEVAAMFELVEMVGVMVVVASGSGCGSDSGSGNASGSDCDSDGGSDTDSGSGGGSSRGRGRGSGSVTFTLASDLYELYNGSTPLCLVQNR